MHKTELLDKYARDGDSRLLLARVLDQWQRAEQRGVPTHTGFLSPAEQAVSADLLMAAAPGQGILAGGYPDAERRLWAFLPDWLEEETWQQGEECPLCALEVETPPGAGLTHRDYLGSLMGLGLTREKLGDILVDGTCCQVLALRESLPILLSQWESAGRWKAKLREISLSALTPKPPQVKVIRDTVAALRLDAVLSSGFSTSRSKAAQLVSAGRVSVNHRECMKSDRTVEQGDVLSCRGLGKCVVKEVLGQSKKGRIMLVLERYI